MSKLNDVEQAIVGTVREFVDREVRPVARELEHADEYPGHLIGQMKRMGVFGLAIPAPYGDVAVSTPCYVALVTYPWGLVRFARCGRASGLSTPSSRPPWWR